MTWPDEDSDRTSRRGSRRVSSEPGPRDFDNPRANDPMFRRLVQELARLEAERVAASHPPSVPPIRTPPVPEEARPLRAEGDLGRTLAVVVVVLFTGLVLVSLALRYLSPSVALGLPVPEPLQDLGRRLFPAALLPYEAAVAVAIVWIVWLLTALRQRGRATEAPLEVPKPEDSEKPTPPPAKRRTAQRILREMRPYAAQIALLFVLSLTAVPLALITPLPIKIILDSVVGSQPLTGFLAWLTGTPSGATKETALALALGILLAGTVLTNLQNLGTVWLNNRVGNRMDVEMRVRLFHQLQRLSTAYHDTKGTVDSTYRIQYDATSLRSLSVDALIPLITSLLTLGGMLGIMATLDWQLASIALSVTPVMFLFTLIYRRRIRVGWRQAKSSESAAMSAAQESLSAARVVKAYGQEDREKDQFRTRYTESASAALKVNVEQGLYTLIVGVVTAIGLAAVLFLGVQHVAAGTLSVGGLFLVYYYLTQLYSPLRDLGKKVLDIQKSLAGMDRFLEILDEKADVPEKPNARPIGRAVGRIAFQGVSFAYDERRPVLRDVSLDLPAGKCLGIVGPTGSGKTTLANLLVRFFDPTAGAITLDGVDLRDYKVADLRNQFAVVLQDTLLFSTTIAENIRFARPGATQRAVEAAAKLANVHDFIMSLPDGYNTLVGERGMKLSGGERQRISLARAFLKNAPILILDEPTSALDMQTEASIIETIRQLMKNRTTVMIAHRPSTLRWCDAILALEPDGRSRLTNEVTASLEQMARVSADGAASGRVDDGTSDPESPRDETPPRQGTVPHHDLSRHKDAGSVGRGPGRPRTTERRLNTQGPLRGNRSLPRAWPRSSPEGEGAGGRGLRGLRANRSRPCRRAGGSARSSDPNARSPGGIPRSHGRRPGGIPVSRARAVRARR